MKQPAGQTGTAGTGQGLRFFDRFGRQPLVIAHRGFRACYPENTRCAFDHSLGRSQMIELDVQLSADGTAVVFHDSNLARTSDAALMARQLGIASLALYDWRLEQLRRLDLGSWFLETDPFRTLASGEADRTLLQALMPQRIMTLKELLAWSAEHDMPLNIELKDMRRTPLADRLVPAVLHEIEAAKAGHRVVLSSFNHEYLRRCRRLAPEIATAALQEGWHPPDLAAYLQTLGVVAYHPENALVDQSLVRTLRAAGLAVNVFTVNDKNRQRELQRFGVTGIFTDFPGRMVQGE
jgi:glycerophosphoryl diester phosphodiesterase